MTSFPAIKAEGSDCLDCFVKLKATLKAHALFAATGGVDAAGAATIIEPLAAIGIPENFVEKYRPLARYDVVGMLFAADPRIAERISAKHYERIPLKGDAHGDLAKRLEIRDYLRKANFEHLLLAGLDSALYGRAWVVAYRGPKESPASEAFTDEEMEIARYTVPSVLFEFLRSCRRAHLTTEMQSRAATGNPIPLNPTRLRIAILEAKGYGASAIAEMVCLEAGTVYNVLGEIRTRLGVKGRHITFHDLEYFTGREINKDQA